MEAPPRSLPQAVPPDGPRLRAARGGTYVRTSESRRCLDPEFPLHLNRLYSDACFAPRSARCWFRCSSFFHHPCCLDVLREMTQAGKGSTGRTPLCAASAAARRRRCSTNSTSLHPNKSPRWQSTVVLARELRPDVCLFDIRMPEIEGIDATRQLAGPDVTDPLAVVVITTFDLDEYVHRALKAGAEAAPRTPSRSETLKPSAPARRGATFRKRWGIPLALILLGLVPVPEFDHMNFRGSAVHKQCASSRGTHRGEPSQSEEVGSSTNPPSSDGEQGAPQ